MILDVVNVLETPACLLLNLISVKEGQNGVLSMKISTTLMMLAWLVTYNPETQSCNSLVGVRLEYGGPSIPLSRPTI